jgi:hypothetical protein
MRILFEYGYDLHHLLDTWVQRNPSAMRPMPVYRDQGAWNVMERSFERKFIPMARSEGNY